MRPPDRSGPNGLSRYWSALIRGAPAAELARLAAPLDPAMIRMIEGMRAMRDDLRPDPAFVDKLEATLVARLARSTSEIYPTARTTAPDGPFRITRSRTPAMSAEPGRLNRRALATFAVVVALMIVGGITALWLLDGRDSNRRPHDPAILAPSTPSPTDEALFEITLPAEVIPQGYERVSGLSYDRYEPNSESIWEPYCCDGPIVQHQLTGAIQVLADAPIQILRAGGELEEIPAQTEATVHTGDTLITLNQTRLTTINSGATSAVVLTWLMLDSPGNRFGGRTGQAGLVGVMHSPVGDITNDLIPLPGAVSVRLDRLIAEPERVVRPEEGEVLLPVVSNPGSELITSNPDGSFQVANRNDEPTTTVYVISLGSAEEGTP